MANTVQKINRRSQVVAHRAATSATDGKLTDSSPGANFQGITLEEASFAQVQNTAPVTSDTDLNRGKIIFTDSTLNPGDDFDREDHALYIPIKSYGRFDGVPNITLSGTLSKFGNAASEEILPKGTGNHSVTWYLQSDEKIKLGGQVTVTAGTPDTYGAKITANPTVFNDAVHNSVHTFAANDVLRIDEGWTNVNCLNVGTDLTSLFSASDVDAGTNTNVATTTSGVGEGLTLDVVSDGSAITSVKVNTIGVGYEVGDTISIAANTLDASHAQIDSSALTANEIASKKATALEITLAAADLAGEVKKLATANDLLCGKHDVSANVTTLEAADIQKGILDFDTSGGPITVTSFDTATNIVAGLNLSAVNEYFDFSVIADGNNSVTLPNLTAGNKIIAANTSGMFRIRATNISAGTEAAQVFRIA